MHPNPDVTILQARPLSVWGYFKQVWSFRLMIVTLARRDLKVKYAQTYLGILWAVIQPLTGLLIFTFFFDRLIHLDTRLPYPLFAFSGMVSWYFFSTIVYGAGMSLIESQDLIKKVYFPKMVLILAKVLVGLVEFAISMVLLFILMLILGIAPGLQIIFFPVFVFINIAVGLSVAIWLSALTIKYRDFHHIIPYLVNYGIWLTPVFFPTTIIPPAFEWILFLNPMAATIAGFRWSLIGESVPEMGYLLSFIPVLFFLLAGVNFFRKIENKISDYV